MTCSICEVLAGARDVGSIAVRDSGWALMPSLHQAECNRGHAVLVPLEHRARLADLSTSEQQSLPTILVGATDAVRRAFVAPGTTIRQNDGPPAQDTPHVHFHIVPRHHDDGFWDAEMHVISLAELRSQASELERAYFDMGRTEILQRPT